ncbi:aspartate/glutamate racemase family protein [Natrarchaeobius chitinivorans]|uniref:Aspartate/glutamate racemase family protein n=1 Tax=Natrarchaeobius chitinivorans TaxID=1679083 RepID=A0A3N6M0C8_NATCH|nr:aspartate/glutamate racemase family protein [Natrarchaeobius chitinivorans]
MKIKAINPNTTEEMTQNIQEVANKYTSPETDVVGVSPDHGPESIESYYDDYLSIPGVLEEILKSEREEDSAYDAYINACWGDPGINACREITSKPVVGIGEASMYIANMLGANFSVVTVLPRARNLTEGTVKKSGLEDKCQSVRCTDLTVVETEHDREATVSALLEASKDAIREDNAEVICLGCAGMGGLDRELEAELPVPVIDSTAAASVLTESLVRLGKTTSKVMTYKQPESKRIEGYEQLYQF